MRTIAYLFFAACVCAPFSATAGQRNHYLELANRAKDSVVALAVAEAGTEAYADLPLGEPLRGGGVTTTVQVAGAGCDYDFRFRFRDGRTLLYRGVDVCRASVLRIRPLPRGYADARVAVSQGR